MTFSANLVDVDRFVDSSAGVEESTKKLYITLTGSYADILSEHSPKNSLPADQQFLKE